jgi:hypothetical protein
MNKSNHLAELLGVGILGLAVAGSARTNAGSLAVPSVVTQASIAFSASMHGLVAMQRHFTTEVQSGPITHEEQSDSGQLMHDGQSVQIAYYRIVRDGREFSPSQLRQRSDAATGDWLAGKVYFKEPYDARYVSDYTFGAPQLRCTACPAGTEAVSFTSAIHDAQHGQGEMYIDPHNARVVRLTYVPYVLPPHASSGSVTEIGGQALHDLWYVVHIDETYRGHAFVISGMGTFTGVFDHFRRFPNLTTGQAALEGNAL